ncbi:hypothetical protein HYU13_00730 [Candidatus Woesearchaeota archaeon]|nr:hypothetical protein [Candidatus Woesearchaeota archaeon]
MAIKRGKSHSRILSLCWCVLSSFLILLFSGFVAADIFSGNITIYNQDVNASSLFNFTNQSIGPTGHMRLRNSTGWWWQYIDVSGNAKILFMGQWQSYAEFNERIKQTPLKNFTDFGGFGYDTFGKWPLYQGGTYAFLIPNTTLKNETYGIMYVINVSNNISVGVHFRYNNESENRTMGTGQLLTIGCAAHSNIQACMADSANKCNWMDFGGFCESMSGFNDAPSAECEMLPRVACNNLNASFCFWDSNAGKRGKCIRGNLFNPEAGGFNCSAIVNQTFCDRQELTQKTGLCSWNGTTCNLNSSKTFMDIQLNPPTFSCTSPLVLNNQTLCENLSSYFLPCGWNNGTSKCDDLFMDFGRFEFFDDISSESTCLSMSGTWNTQTTFDPLSGKLSSESWCEMGIAIKDFGQQGGSGAGFSHDSTKLGDCNAGCWNCDFNSTGGRWQNATAAQSQCEGSRGGCKFKSDSNAFNGYGWCTPLFEFGGGGDCSKFCGDCNNMKQPNVSCANSAAGCKWDNVSSLCIGEGVKGCNQDCFSCQERAICDTSFAQGGCQWDGSSQICKPREGNFEVCYDTMDNDNNGKVDCQDFKCSSDPFCGGTIGDASSCFQYEAYKYGMPGAQNNCTAVGDCVWIIDDHGFSYCAPQSELCFTNTSLTSPATCDSVGGGGVCKYKSGVSVCTENESMARACVGKNQGDCGTTRGCRWSSGFGGMGFCDFAPIVTCEENETLAQNKSLCESSGCYWQGDDFGGFEGGFFSPCVSPCFNNSITNSVQCAGANGSAFVRGTCAFQTGFCEPSSFVGGCKEKDGDIASCKANTKCNWFEPPMGPMLHPNGSTNPRDFSFTGQTWVGAGLEYPIGGPFSQNESTYTINKTSTKTYVQLFISNPNTTGPLKNVSAIYCNSTFVAEYYFNDSSCVLGSCNAYNGSFFCGADKLHYYLSPGNRTVEILWEVDQNFIAFNAVEGDTVITTTTNKTTIKIDGNVSEMINETASAGSGAKAYRALTSKGFCNDGQMNSFFSGMDNEPPINIASDAVGGSSEPSQQYADIQDIGVKKTPQAYMYGMRVRNVSYSALCYNTAIGPDRIIGTGANTSKYYIYLDTDGTATGGCSPENTASLVGFEYLFKYIVEVDSSNRVAETFMAQSCSNSSWIASNIPLKSDRTKACEFVNGPIFAIDKDTLNGKSNVNTTKSWRAYGVSANSTGNSTGVVDTVGPGASDFKGIDFEIVDCTNPGQKSNSQCTKFQQFGFFPGEFGPQCADSKDNDGDGSTDCTDFDCKFDPFFCSSTGFNADPNDKDSPQLFWNKVNNKVPNSLTIIYDSNEPSNGTIKFYNNDTTCSTLNNTFFDKALLDSNAHDNFRPHHVTDVTGLVANKTYFYKVYTCDVSGNCASSKCSNATTALAHSNITFVVDAPPGWVIDIPTMNLSNYSLDYALKSSTEYLSNTNLTVKNQSTGAQITFVGVDIFEKATFNISQFLTGSSLLGMDAAQFQSLKQKTGAEKVLIRIPTSSTGNTISHCDEDGSNCKSVTSTITCTYASTYTECTIPDAVGLGFSTYKTTASSSGSSSSSSSSGGGGGGSAGGGGGGAKTKTISLELNEEFNKGEDFEINPTQGTLYTFKILGEDHKLNVSKLYADRIVLVLSSDPITAVFFIGNEKRFDFNADAVSDISVMLKSITGGSAKFILKKLTLDQPAAPAEVQQAAAPEPVQESVPEQAPQQEAVQETAQEAPTSTIFSTMYIFILVLVALIIISIALKKKKKDSF